MKDRDRLDVLVDQLPDDFKLQIARTQLEQLLQAQVLREREPVLPPDAMQARRNARDEFEQYRSRVQSRLEATGRSGPAEYAGGGSHASGANRSIYLEYQKDETLVRHSLLVFDNEEIELMQQFSKSDDGSKLIYEDELICKGRIVNRKEEFDLTGSTSR